MLDLPKGLPFRGAPYWRYKLDIPQDEVQRYIELQKQR